VANRLFNVAVLGSAAIFCLIVGAWLMAGNLDPRRQFVSLSQGCHFSMKACGMDSRLVIFNDATFGPYAGSIIAIAGTPNGPSVSGFGDTAGVYYRLIRWPNGHSFRTLTLSLFYPLIVTAILPTIWIVRRSRPRVPGPKAVGNKL
jgi:hypothetical protein